MNKIACIYESPEGNITVIDLDEYTPEKIAGLKHIGTVDCHVFLKIVLDQNPEIVKKWFKDSEMITI